MKLVFEKVRGSGVPVKSVMIEREDLPWNDEQECDAQRSFKTSVKVALAYHRLTSLDPDTISRNDLMSYLGYGPKSTKTAAYEKLPDVLHTIGCVCDGFGKAQPRTRLSYQLDFDVLKIDEPLSEAKRKEYLKQYSPYILLSPYQIFELMKVGKASIGGKFNEFLRVYLAMRRDMKSCCSNGSKLYLGMYAMISQSRLREPAGLNDKTIAAMVDAMERAGLIFKLSGRNAGEDVYSINCYATTKDPQLVDTIRKAQLEKGVKKKHFVAGRKGHGSSIFDQSIRDAVGEVSFWA